VLSEGVRELPDLGNIRPAQGNAHAYKALTEPAKGEAGNQLAATQVFLGSIAAVQQSLQEGLIDMAVGRRLIEINDSVPEALANLVVDYEKLFSRLDSQMISVRCETDRLIKQYYDDRTFLGRALSRLNLREAEFERLRASSEQANLVQHAIQTKLSDALARNETLTAKLAEARTQNETLNRELSAESTSNDALSRSLLDVRAQSETSAGELAAERAKNNILNADLTGVHAQNDRLRRELITSRNEIETLGADLATARTQIDAMQAEISEARNENDALRNNVASATAHNEALSEDLRSAVTERHALRTELVARRAENDSLRGDRALMRTQHEALSAQLATALGQNDWLRTELERRKAQLRKFKRSVSWQVTSPLRVIKRVVFAFVPKTQRP
jgi:chromosome segregation ATPase